MQKKILDGDGEILPNKLQLILGEKKSGSSVVTVRHKRMNILIINYK